MSLSEYTNDEATKWAALEALRAELFRTGRPYLFVDPTMGTPWDRSESNGAEAYREITLDLRALRFPVQACPFLVPLQDTIGGFFDQSFELAWAQGAEPQRPYPVCGWISSDLPVNELRRHLVSHMSQREDDKRWLLRFYDPRVGRHMTAFVDGGFRLGGLNGWWFIASTGKLRTLPVGDANTRTELPRSAAERLDWLRVINRASADWLAYTAGSAVDDGRLYDAVHVAAEMGMSPLQEADCIAFILHRCLVHGQIEQHPKVAAWLADARSGSCHYVDAAACAGPEIWSEIAAGQWLFKSSQKQGASHG
ncbi:DUF4123 domain-containing protein [Stenotrophomonas humi]